MTLGKHFIGDFYGVDSSLINFKNKVYYLLESTVEKFKFDKRGSVYHQFNPYGVTAVILIAESHISIHTWPEYGIVNLEIFTCGDFSQAENAFNELIKILQPKDYEYKIIDRGMVN